MSVSKSHFVVVASFNEHECFEALGRETSVQGLPASHVTDVLSRHFPET